MFRYAASVQYDGSSFFGWQTLHTGLPTIQAAVEYALSKIANHPVSVCCAGRTDARVHGCNQIIHFDTHAMRTERDWVFGTNANLPDTISLNWVKRVPNDFHARFSALWRCYRYVIYNHHIRPVHLSKGVTWSHQRLELELMKEAAGYLIGEHDFTSYRSSRCQAKNKVRRVTKLDLSQHGYFIVIDTQANAFLHHMIRNVVGVLMAVGCGKRQPIWSKEVLEARNRTLGGKTASPSGLYFLGAGYDEIFGLPSCISNAIFIAPNVIV